MYRKFKSVSLSSFMCFTLTAPVFMSGTSGTTNPATPTEHCIIYEPVSSTTLQSPATVLQGQADQLYDNMRLQRAGLSKKAFEYAWKGYKYLLRKGYIQNREMISICDFSQSSRHKRMYIIDVAQRKIMMKTYVTHGRKSGGEYARSFSNSADSHKSSLGFYITGNTYWGGHGLALKVKGLERGINDRANERNIVIHGSEYVGPNYLRYNRYAGRSYGCPAVPAKDTKKVIELIKDGSCFFIYHPTRGYLSQSKILNG